MDGSDLAGSVRLLEEQDIPWVLDLAETAYKRPLDRAKWTKLVLAMLKVPNILILRGVESCVVAECYKTEPDSDQKDGRFIYWFHHGNSARDLVRVFEAAIGWMKECEVTNIWLRPTTGIDAAPLANVLGFNVSFPTYVRRM